jgi:hypothetical protein
MVSFYEQPLILNKQDTQFLTQQNDDYLYSPTPAILNHRHTSNENIQDLSF